MLIDYISVTLFLRVTLFFFLLGGEGATSTVGKMIDTSLACWREKIIFIVKVDIISLNKPNILCKLLKYYWNICLGHYLANLDLGEGGGGGGGGGAISAW